MKITNKIIISIAVCASIIFTKTNHAFAQDAIGENEIEIEAEAEQIDGKKDKNLRFSLLGGPGYTPDYGLLLGGGALMTFHLRGMEEFEQRSVLPVAFSLTLGKNIALSLLVRPQLFMNQDKIRLMGEFVYANLSSNYYGVGFETNKATQRGETITEYFSSQLIVNPILLFRMGTSDWFVGPTTNFIYEKISDPAAGVVADADYIAAGGDDTGYISVNSGVGFSLNYDSRDIPANAYSGVYFDFKALAYGDFFGGDYNFHQLQIKYKQYTQLSQNKTGRTLAWSVYTDNVFGDAPFTRLATVGSPFDLRGYYKGQYRDNSTHVAMVEYRHKFHVNPVDLWSKLANRLGFVTWAGTGLIGPSPFDIEGVLPNLGAGLRIELQPRMNFRIDMGYSPIEKQTLVYFNMTESF